MVCNGICDLFVINLLCVRIFCDGSIVFFFFFCWVATLFLILRNFKGCCWLRSVFITTKKTLS